MLKTLHKINFERFVITLLLFASCVFITRYIQVYFFSDYYVSQKDLYAYLTAGHALRNANTYNLYDLNTQDTYQRALYGFQYAMTFRYPPFSVLLFLPFGYMSAKTGYIVVMIVNTLLTFLGLKLLIPKKVTHKQIAIMIMLLFTFSGFYVLNLIGQLYGITFFLFSLMYYFFKRDQFFWLGVSTALLAIKPQLLIAVPFLIVMTKFNKRFFIGLITTGSILYVISALVSGMDFILKYLNFILKTESLFRGVYIDRMTNFFSLFNSIKSYNEILFYIVNILVLVALVFIIRTRVKVSKETLFGAFIIFTILLAPHNTSYDSLILGVFTLLNLYSSKSSYEKILNFIVLILIFLVPALAIAKLISIKMQIVLILFSALLKLFEADIHKLLERRMLL